MTSPCLVLLGGGPGSGKSRLAHALAARWPTSVVLDKDVLCSPWVDAMLRARTGAIDRDSETYWQEIRPLEYRVLLDAAFDVLRDGRVVLAVAPFGPELADERWLADLRGSLHAAGATLRVVWLEADAETVRERMVRRNAARDGWKLTHWSDFVAQARFTPPRPGICVVSNDRAADFGDVVNRAARCIEEESC